MKKAVKILQKVTKYTYGTSRISSIQTEITAIKKLNHPNLVKYYEYFYDDDVITEKSLVAIVTEFCEVNAVAISF
jgi:serine/threonine protein kinase